MGKSGGKKKKTGYSQNQSQTQTTTTDSNQPPVSNGRTINLDSPLFLKRAHELREEGNKRFQARDYAGAFQQYEKAIKLIPKTHPDLAFFHSNRAACLMLMKPIDYEAVISECNLALAAQPSFSRALLRRARAFEAIGNYDMAMLDAQMLLITDPNHSDALEMFYRLGTTFGPRQKSPQDLQSRPSPAALGASAVRGAPIAGLGPRLPARPVQKKQSTVLPNQLDKLYSIPSVENGPENKTLLPKVGLKPPNGPVRSDANITKDDIDKRKEHLTCNDETQQFKIQYRPLKLVYDHDIRLAQMPVNCSFKVLRDVVGKRFPMSKFVLIKYKDCDGDLITITSSAELRLAESSADSIIPKNPETKKSDSIGLLRLHVVKVDPEQEPPLIEEEDEKEEEKEEKPIEPEPKCKIEKVIGEKEEPECKEVEMDDWLFEFAQLFRAHVGIDSDAHTDLHEIGMELCSKALEETVTSENAQALLDKAASKFQEVAALAFFNWGNVHMCSARKQMPLDESARKEVVNEQLQASYDWVKEKYTLAREKYEEALTTKPDFCEGLLALAQQQFEMAKLHWLFVLGKKTDLLAWDPAETIGLFDSAEEKMKAATEMWEMAEKQRADEPKKEEVTKSRMKQGEAAPRVEVSPEEAAEQAAVMRNQIHLFWGNLLFERSQIECKMGLRGWRMNLDNAVERFKLAGASEEDISTVLKSHYLNEGGGDGVEGNVDGSSVFVVEKGDV